MIGDTGIAPLPILFAFVLFTAALYTDIRTKRIPNLVTIPIALIGLVYHLLAAGSVAGLFYALKGLFLGCLLLIIPFMLGGMGGGDVKLLGALGALVGPVAVFWAFLYGAMAGGGIALFIMIRGAGLPLFKNFWNEISIFVLTRHRVEPATDAKRFPYTVPMAIGFVIFIIGGKMC